jgi:5-(carboxyamino)imidazole ribonucleotide synthase
MIKTVGVLGAGQLARMLAQCGRPMGLDFIFLDPAEDACAAEFGEHICAGWDDEAALGELGRRADVVTFDFENVPEASASLIESLCPMYPPPRALYASQDRLREKTLMQQLGIPVAPFYPVSSRPDLLDAVAAIGLPCVLKTRRFGYDGKGQAVLRFQEDMERAWQQLGGSELICEGYVSFQAECSIIAARDRRGHTVFWPLTRNLHRGGILAISMAPAFDAALQARAEAMLLKLLEHLDYTGVMALELFVVDGRLLANEFAPRVHNSGHWSIDGARTSQFENHLRAICGMPLGETASTHRALMFNLLGEMPAFALQPSTDSADIPGVRWHDYHKTPREGRKIGHVTLTASSDAALRARATQLAAILGVAAELNLEAVLAESIV